MKHAVISEKPPTKPRPLAGKAALKSILQSIQIVEKQSKSSPKNNEAKAVKEVSAKQFVPVIAPTIEKTASAKSPPKAKINIVGTPKLKAKSAKTAEIAAAQVSAKKSQTTASKRPLKAEAAKIKVFADAKAAVTREIKIAAVAKSRTVLKSPAKAPAKKTQPVIAAKKLVVKNTKPKSFAPIVETKPAGKKVEAIAGTKKTGVKIAGKINKPKSAETGKKVEVKEIAVIENNPPPEKLPTVQMLKKMAAELIISAKVNKIQAQIRSRKIAPIVQIKKPVIVENKIEEAAPRLPAKPKNKKAKLIGSAIFRGKEERYDFKVFALNETFEAIPAVYIISKRTTDTRKKAHHALICIGETHSIFDELKKHRKEKCVKKHRANVVSILPEADEKIRLKIETDLKAAHSVACLLD